MKQASIQAPDPFHSIDVVSKWKSTEWNWNVFPLCVGGFFAILRWIFFYIMNDFWMENQRSEKMTHASEQKHRKNVRIFYKHIVILIKRLHASLSVVARVFAFVILWITSFSSLVMFFFTVGWVEKSFTFTLPLVIHSVDCSSKWRMLSEYNR